MESPLGMATTRVLERDWQLLVYCSKPKIMLKQMPDTQRFNKLKPESTLCMNVIKMICYRAETVLAEMGAPFFYKEKNEKRMLIKQLFNTTADLMPSAGRKTLTIQLAALSAIRYNEGRAGRVAKVG